MSRDTNRYAVLKSSRLPRRKRTISVPGDLEDSNRYFRCWYCGFINSIEQASIGDGDGVTQLDTPEISTESAMSGDPLSVVIYLDDPFTLLKLGPDGEPITNYRYNQYPYVFGGCAFCGSRNWV